MGYKPRSEYATEEEWQAAKARQETLPKAAFQFGVKMADGRKSQSKLGKGKADQKINTELQKIQARALTADAPDLHPPCSVNSFGVLCVGLPGAWQSPMLNGAACECRFRLLSESSLLCRAFWTRRVELTERPLKMAARCRSPAAERSGAQPSGKLLQCLRSGCGFRQTRAQLYDVLPCIMRIERAW